MFRRLIACAGTFFLLLSTLAAQVPPLPIPGCPNPVGVQHGVSIRGVVQPNETFVLNPNGTWVNSTPDTEYGFGIYEIDFATCTISYINLSGDGGGNQCGIFTWQEGKGEWARTWASHPQAPPMALIPPQ